MSFFSLHKSKKTSESGTWIPDEEVAKCQNCSDNFSFLLRRHHCRECGKVVCGACSSNRKYLDSSRSGAPKRVCDPCFNKDRAGGDDEPEAPRSKVAVSAASASISATGGSSAAPSGSSVVAAAQSYQAAKSAPANAGIVPTDVAVQALKDHPFEGKWAAMLTYHAVDMPNAPSAVPIPARPQSTRTGPSRKGKEAEKEAAPVFVSKDGVPGVGYRQQISLVLETKGAAYFKGVCKNFGYFGKDGKVTGSLQRSNGKVNMTIQVISAAKVTTSINFVGMMNKKGIYMGTFSGCEISKNAGSVSGVFRMLETPYGLDDDEEEEKDDDEKEGEGEEKKKEDGDDAEGGDEEDEEEDEEAMAKAAEENDARESDSEDDK